MQNNGTGKGVAAPVVSPASLKFTALGSANAQTFTVTVQYAGDLTAASSNTGVATVSPSAASPTVTPTGGGTKSATFTVTPVGNGTCTITVTDKKGSSVTVAVTVTTVPLPKYLYFEYGDKSCGSGCIVGFGGPIYMIDADANGGANVLGALPLNQLVSYFAVAADGSLWVSGYGTRGLFHIEGGPQGLNNPTPLAVISGSNTGFYYPQHIALDAHDVYVDNNDAAIVRFPATANGNVAPSASIPASVTQNLTTTLHKPLDIAAANDGTLYVADSSENPLQYNGTGFAPPGDIAIFAPNTNGNVAPSAILGGPNTQIDFPSHVALDAQGDIFVYSNDNYLAAVGASFATASNPRIIEFAPGSTGNATPIAVIEGPSTGMKLPYEMRVDPAGGVYVADYAAQSIFYYPPGSNGDVTPARTLSSSYAQQGFGYFTLGL